MSEYLSPDGLSHDKQSILDRTNYLGEPVACSLCGEFMGFQDDLEYGETEHRECRRDKNSMDTNVRKIDVFQKALNDLPGDVINTLHIIAESYANGLSDKNDIPENVQFWMYVANEGLEESKK